MSCSVPELGCRESDIRSAFVPFFEDLGNISEGHVHTKVATELFTPPLQGSPPHTHLFF